MKLDGIRFRLVLPLVFERNGRMREAAEIAEARERASEIIVRQWFIAGEKERAIQVARRTEAFHGAVLRLEKSRHPAAPELRKLWALKMNFDRLDRRGYLRQKFLNRLGRQAMRKPMLGTIARCTGRGLR